MREVTLIGYTCMPYVKTDRFDFCSLGVSRYCAQRNLPMRFAERDQVISVENTNFSNLCLWKYIRGTEKCN
jgi:hypothetical protein